MYAQANTMLGACAGRQITGVAVPWEAICVWIVAIIIVCARRTVLRDDPRHVMDLSSRSVTPFFLPAHIKKEWCYFGIGREAVP